MSKNLPKWKFSQKKCKGVALDSLTELTHWSHSLNSPSELAHWTQSLNSLSELSHWTESLSWFSELTHWTHSLKSLTEVTFWTGSLNSVTELTQWTQSLNWLTELTQWTHSVNSLTEVTQVTKQKSKTRLKQPSTKKLYLQGKAWREMIIRHHRMYMKNETITTGEGCGGVPLNFFSLFQTPKPQASNHLVILLTTAEPQDSLRGSLHCQVWPVQLECRPLCGQNLTPVQQILSGLLTESSVFFRERRGWWGGPPSRREVLGEGDPEPYQVIPGNFQSFC